MFEQLSVFEDPDSSWEQRGEARIRLGQLFYRRWHATWDNRPFPRLRFGPREETVHPNPAYL